MPLALLKGDREVSREGEEELDEFAIPVGCRGVKVAETLEGKGE